MKRIPLHSLVIMVGPTQGGKTWIADHRFKPHEILGAETMRESLVGDRSRMDVDDVTFKEIYRRTTLKIDLGERVVVDAGNLRRRDRLSLADIGSRAGVPIYYVVCDRPLEEKLGRPRSSWGPDVEAQASLFGLNEKDILRGDGVANVIDMRIDDFTAVEKLPGVNLQQTIASRGFRGLMVIGDVHGMLEPLKSATEWATRMGLFCVFLGDVVSYGAHSIDCVNHVYDVVTRGRGLSVIGNHERKLERWMEQSRRNDVRVRLSDGNKVATRAIQMLPPEARHRFQAKFRAMVGLSRHHWIVGDTMFAHAAVDPEMFDIWEPRLRGRLESLALFGEIDPKEPKRSDGYPNKIYEWVDRIPAGKSVMVGHDIRGTTLPLQVQGSGGGRAYFMDTGSGKGGRLTSADVYFEGTGQVVKNFKYH